MTRRILTLDVILLLAVASLPAQNLNVQIELNPPNPTSADSLNFKLSGTWRDGCVPQSPVVSLSITTVTVDTSNPGVVCAQALTPWTLSGSIGRLKAGSYDFIARYTGAGASSPVEIGRKSFSVVDSSLLQEVVFPVVVNGSLSEKLYYQTIFTILNTASQGIHTVLEVYGNDGDAAGVFCSPLAPPPSTLTADLNPNAQFLQFTSADLPFRNGWARLRWEGSEPVLASEEITLAEGAPPPCLLICNRPSNEKLSSTQIAAVRAAREFHLPVTINGYRQTALALINPSNVQSAHLKVTILDTLGKNAALAIPGSFEVTLPPMQRVSKFLWQLAAEQSPLTAVIPPPDSFQGSVVVTADSPVAVAALHLMFPEGKFVSVPTFSPLP